MYYVSGQIWWCRRAIIDPSVMADNTHVKKIKIKFRIYFYPNGLLLKIWPQLINMYIEWIGSGRLSSLRRSFGFEKIISIKT